MRKGTTIFLPAALALSTIACLMFFNTVIAATLEPTDSGAPSAIVMFPVGEKSSPKVAAMQPVAFNHVIHEKWMAKTGKNCIICHHTGDPVACTECHTVEGSEKGKNITLYEAMHKVEITRKSENQPSSCVSCHEKQLTQRDCSGCHGRLVKNPRDSKSWCAVCHTITPSLTEVEMQAGIKGKLSESKNEKLGSETVLAREQTAYWSAMKAPYKVEIDSLKGIYEPCIFNHRHHIQSLMNRIKNNKLAGAFHTNEATICMTCHHNSPASTTPPKCSSCHTKEIDREHPERPRLLAAYHLQCMSCHTDMKVSRPRSRDCQTCHKLNTERRATN